MRNQHHTAGYSLMELMVVLAILALVMTAGLPFAVRALDSMTIESDARLLATRLRELRTAAMDTQRDIAVTLAAEPASRLQSSDGQVLDLSRGTSASIEAPGPRQAMVVGWDGSVSGRIVLSNGRKRLHLHQRAPYAPIVIEAAR